MILLPPLHILRLQARVTTLIEETFSAEYSVYVRLSVTDSEPAPSYQHTKLARHFGSMFDIKVQTLTFGKLEPLYVPTWQQFDRADNAFSGVLFPVYNINSCFSFLFSETMKSVSACPWKLFGNGKGFGRWLCHRSVGVLFLIYHY